MYMPISLLVSLVLVAVMLHTWVGMTTIHSYNLLFSSQWYYRTTRPLPIVLR